MSRADRETGRIRWPKDATERALDAVACHPGLTSNELARATGLDRYMLARRLPELCDHDRVVRGDPRRCEVSGRKAATWWPAREP